MNFRDWMHIDLGALLRGQVRTTAPSIRAKAPRHGRIPAKRGPIRRFLRRIFSGAPGGPELEQADLLDQIYRVTTCGAPVVSGLTRLVEDCPDAKMARQLDTLRLSMEQGSSLSEALDQLGIYPRYYVDLIRAGERSGTLEKMLAELRERLMNRTLLMRKFTFQFLYGLVVVVIAFMAVGVFGRTIAEMGREYGINEHSPGPLPARCGIWIFGLMTDSAGNWWVPNVGKLFEGVLGVNDDLFRFSPFLAFLVLPALVAVIGGLCAAVFLVLRRFHPIRWIFLHTPVLGHIIHLSEWGLVAQILSRMLQAGYPELEAVRAARDAHVAKARKSALARIETRVSEGGSLCEAMRREGRRCPETLVVLTGLGESSGMLPDTLDRAGHLLDLRAHRLARITASITLPAMVIMLGFLVLSINSFLFITLTSISDGILGGM